MHQNFAVTYNTSALFTTNEMYFQTRGKSLLLATTWVRELIDLFAPEIFSVNKC